ncbi:ComEC/Rec2 family competence protein [Flavobacterium sp. TSSA_36]|uniref:ComEC/Rec2 family competence protein n=1 Tax=Flavobacterium sp. TSSA_36 TaxID=3447669 RepID=UPI003F3C1C1B
MNLLRFPLIKFTIGLLLGLVLAYEVSFSLVFSLRLAAFSALIFCVAYWWVIRKETNHWFFDGSVFWTSMVLGVNLMALHTQTNQPSHYYQDPSIFKKTHQIEVVITEKWKSNTFSDRYIAAVQCISNRPQKGLLLLHIHKKTKAIPVKVGSRLRFNSLVMPNTLNKNPYQFDYSRYLKNKQIFGQIYLNPEEIEYQSIPEKSVGYFAATLRQTVVENLQKSGFNAKALPVAMALILGQQQEIDPSITQDYQYAGAVHILSVSGLHIGSLVLFIHFLLGPIPNTKKGRLVKLMVSLTLLALFGILAGLAASVVRSITMFAIIAVGQYFNRSTSIYHTLMVSLLLILLFQPYFLFDVGFQLSYVALFFIVWLQPMLVRLWQPKYKIVQFFWNILTVSFAAQIGTFPLSIYYFHQFPGLFFVTNVLVLPFIGVIMFLGVVVVITAFFSTVPFWMYQPLEMGISLMNAIIHKVASFEAFIFVGIPFNGILLLVSFLMIFTVVFWIQKPTFFRLLAVIVSVILFQLSYFSIKMEFEATQEWVVLQASKQTLICERKGQQIEVVADSTVIKTIATNKVIQQYATGTFSSITKVTPLNNLAYFKGNRILILDSAMVRIPGVKTDILLLTHSPKVNLERILNICQPRKVVIDGSNFKSLVALWKKTCQAKKIPFHVTSEKGYFILK